jgi:hypothetical protein
MTFPSSRAVLWLAAFSWCTTPAWADEGHDHGDAPAAIAESASPRFTATSDNFELVGVLDGKQLTLYLDRYADNSPVSGAQIALAIGGVKVPVESDAPGLYEATLAEAPKPGETPFTATVTTGADTELLTGEIDLHEASRTDDAAPGPAWHTVASWAVGALVAIAVLVWMGRRVRSARSVRTGGAA